jgi:hypothetical protein
LARHFCLKFFLAGSARVLAISTTAAILSWDVMLPGNPYYYDIMHWLRGEGCGKRKEKSRSANTLSVASHPFSWSRLWGGCLVLWQAEGLRSWWNDTGQYLWRIGERKSPRA